MTWKFDRAQLLAWWLTPLRELQARSGIPVPFSLAHFAHEALHGDNTLSQLAQQHHNWAGLKFRLWQQEYGAKPVQLHTWEVLDGTRWEGEAAFASFPDTGRFLAAYEHLLTTWYSEAFAYISDPLLFAYAVWRGGYATDPRWLLGVAGRMVEFDLLDLPAA